jgi:hypothetical protein
VTDSAATECGDPTDLDHPDSEEVLILKEGFLMKRGFINTAFKRRWCVLRGRQILFYRNYTDRNIRGIINIQDATVEIAEDKKRNLPFGFYLNTPCDRYPPSPPSAFRPAPHGSPWLRYHSRWLLQAASEEEMLSWINAIQISSIHFETKVEEKEVSSCLVS